MMSSVSKVVLYKNRSKTTKLNFLLGYRGFSAPPTLNSFLSQKLQDLTKLIPQLKIRVLMEKSFIKDLYVLSLHTRFKGKDVCIRAEDTCPYGVIKKSMSNFLGQLRLKKNDLPLIV